MCGHISINFGLWVYSGHIYKQDFCFIFHNSKRMDKKKIHYHFLNINCYDFDEIVQQN